MKVRLRGAADVMVGNSNCGIYRGLELASEAEATQQIYIAGSDMIDFDDDAHAQKSIGKLQCAGAHSN